MELKTQNRIIPKIWGHDRELTVEGFGSHNAKEYCKCDDCSNLRIRRNKNYKNSWFNKLIQHIF